MFDCKHYVPVLRWRQGEWLALRDMRLTDKGRMTPLIELHPKDFNAAGGSSTEIDEVLNERVHGIKKNWGEGQFFLDAHLINPNKRTASGLRPIELVSKVSRVLGLCLVPVAGLTRDPEYQNSVRSIANTDKRGVCIRLLREEFRSTDLEERLGKLINELGVSNATVDLIVDLQVIENHVPSLTRICSLVPFVDQWRTFTVIGGAFPKDLTKFSVGRHEHPRLEWQMWRNGIETPLPRQPSFGDYTTQHGIYVPTPPRPNFSASIRYTCDDYWLVMRGEGVFHEGSPGFAQWPANAQLLCERSEYAGRKFSYGDNYIYEMGSQTERTGSPETWLRAGINHHLTYVVHQLSMSFGSSTVSAPIPAIGRR